MDIYDRPGWQSFTYQFPLWGSIARRANDEIVTRFDTADSSGINDDFYFEHYRVVVLSSKDGGKSGKEIDRDWDYNIPLKLSDGTLIEVIQEGKLKSRAAQKARLKELRLRHVWRDDCLLAWDLWPESHLERLKAEGYNIWAKHRNGDDFYLPKGVITTHAPSRLVMPEERPTTVGKPGRNAMPAIWRNSFILGNVFRGRPCW